MAKKPKGRPANPAPREETKAAKFIRLAPARVEKAAKALRALKKMASKSYEYTPEQISQIDTFLSAEFDSCMDAFRSAPNPNQIGFAFGSEEE